MNFKQFITLKESTSEDSTNQQKPFIDWLNSKNYIKLTKEYEDKDVTNYVITTRLIDDTFIHFTLKKRANQIIKTKKLLVKPPYKNFLYPGVYAVSANFGRHVRDSQYQHKEKRATPTNPVVAVIFKTRTMPSKSLKNHPYGLPEEVSWDKDVNLINPIIVSKEEAINMIKNNKPKMDKKWDDFSIIYV